MAFGWLRHLSSHTPSWEEQIVNNWTETNRSFSFLLQPFGLQRKSTGGQHQKPPYRTVGSTSHQQSVLWVLLTCHNHTAQWGVQVINKVFSGHFWPITIIPQNGKHKLLTKFSLGTSDLTQSYRTVKAQVINKVFSGHFWPITIIPHSKKHKSLTKCSLGTSDLSQSYRTVGSTSH